MHQRMPWRFWRGMTSAAGLLTVPFGRLCCRGIAKFRTQRRLERGLVILLPGIQGQSHIEAGIAKGLDDAGIEMAIEVFDWTTGCGLLFPYHLCALNRNRRMAGHLVDKVCRYRDRYPGRPVHLIGHSGGAGLALLAMEAMPAGRKVTSIILLAPAVSPTYDLRPAFEHVEGRIWNFCSWFDLLFLGMGTLILGTIDRRHASAAGMRGFSTDIASSQPTDSAHQRLCRQPFLAGMLRSWNLSGHFGCTNRLFVADWLAPLLRDDEGPSSART